MARENGNAPLGVTVEHTPAADTAAARLFAGPGEVRALGRACDWAATPLGPVAGWSPALRAAVRLMLDAPGAMSLYAGPAFVTLYNDAFRRVLGAKHPAALGRPAADVWSEVWAATQPQVERVRAGGPGLDLRDVPFTLARGDGGASETGWFDYALSPIREEGTDDQPGAVVAILSVVTETTARFLAEAAVAADRARLSRLLDAAPAVMAVYSGPEHVITYVNPTWERVVGKPGAMGRTIREVFPEMIPTGIFEQLGRVYATGEPWTVTEAPLPIQRQPDAPVEDSFWSFVWLPLPGAYPVGPSGLGGDVLVHAVDVTTQVRARQEIEAARAEAEAANRSKGEFLAVMSHELRTPLNAIGGYAELMEMGIRGPITEQQREDLGRIQRSQRHLLGLVNEVLNYAKLESGSVRYAADHVVVHEALADAAALVAPQARAKGLAVRVSECRADLAVRADHEKLRQVLVNLLSNAIKFTDHGGGGAELAVTCDAAAGTAAGTVAIRVRDTGIGIPADKLEVIFEPFVQVRADLTRTADGTGLGLAISRDLARGMHGDLTAESMPGAGSTFTLTLPASPAAG